MNPEQPQPEQKRKRGRPRKNPIPADQRTTVVGDPTDPSFSPDVLKDANDPVVKSIDLSTLDPNFKPGLRATYLAEVFTTLPKFKSDEERVIWLRHNITPALRYLLQLAFSSVAWVVEEPQFTYHKGRPGSAPTELVSELRRLYLFLDGGAQNLDPKRRQKLYVTMLESLDPTEAQLMLDFKNRAFNKYSLTRELVDYAFPGLLALPFNGRFIR